MSSVLCASVALVAWVVFPGSSSACREDFHLTVGLPPPVLPPLNRLRSSSLKECVLSCRSFTDCAAFQFLPGLCILYPRGPADLDLDEYEEYPGEENETSTMPDIPAENTTSEYESSTEEERNSNTSDGWKLAVEPEWRVAGQRMCTEGCGKLWSMEILVDRELPPGSNALTYQTSSRAECQKICLNHTDFSCRSANYYTNTGDCVIMDSDRWTSEKCLEKKKNCEYLENNCAPNYNSICQFTSTSGRALAATDALYTNVESLEECRNLCLTNKEFKCRSFDYGVTDKNHCRLSHEASIGPIRGPYFTKMNAVSYHLTSCYNVTVQCGASTMIAKISSDKIFRGKIYAKSRPNSCVQDVKSQTDFRLDLGFNSLDCDVKQESPGKFKSDIVIQHHDQIVTEQDVGLTVRCSYSLGNRSVGHAIELGVQGGPTSGGSHESSFVLSPTVTMTITDRNGGDVHTAQVGDPLSLQFGIVDTETPYDIFVRELIALDGVDSNEIVLIDSDGCPTDPTIMGAVKTTSKRGVLEAPFDAFKFPTSDIVQFKALVTPCLPSCEPASCIYHDVFGSVRTVHSLGRRKRDTFAGPHEEMVVKTIQIKDKFGHENANNGVLGKKHSFQTCDDRFSVLLVVLCIVGAQLIFFAIYCSCLKCHPGFPSMAITPYAETNWGRWW